MSDTSDARHRSSAVELRDVRDVAPVATRIVDQFRADAADALGDAEVHHIGATALPSGRTKGDVDVNVRIDAARFAQLVAALEARYEAAQRASWTANFASFAATGYELLLGIQVTVVGSEDDFLLALRDLMLADPDLAPRYDAVKAAAAPGGPEAYWRAKDSFLATLKPWPASDP